ncbi:MAG: TIGR04540 family protein [Maledivibacter sp.]|jgi:uncharacterized protein (TIGR04540 family)|nr:TIGR04540 family protein [Maledivibacter sp.]
MDIQRHPSSVLKLSHEMKKVIDAYWSRDITEEEMREYIIYFANYEKEKLFHGPEYSPTIKQRLGKRRIALIDKILQGFQTKLHI